MQKVMLCVLAAVVILAGCNERKFDRIAGLAISTVAAATTVQSAIVAQLAADGEITAEDAATFEAWAAPIPKACQEAAQVLASGESVEVRATKIALVFVRAKQPLVLRAGLDARVKTAYAAANSALEAVALQLQWAEAKHMPVNYFPRH